MGGRKKRKRPLEMIHQNTVTLTPEAAEKMKDALGESSALGVRLQVKQSGSGGVSFSLLVEDEIRPDDLVFEDRGIKLILDPRTARNARGIAIRYVTTKKGSGFSIVDPGSG